MNDRRRIHGLIALAALLMVVLACSGTIETLRIGGIPQYTCPSDTPRPTPTQPPTSRPLWPPYFVSNLDWYQVGTNFNTIHVQWTGQHAGTVYVAYAGSMSTSPFYWPGSSGYIAVDTIPGPTRTHSLAITIPTSVYYATITIYASGVASSNRTYTVTRVPYPIYPNPLYPPPGGAPGSMTATPRPTYTPWPTPTLYVRTADYFVGDPVYSPLQPSGLQVRYRVTRVTTYPTPRLDAQGQPQSIFVWQLEVRNVGTMAYSIFPAAQMYVSTITLPGGQETEGIWGASIAAAEEAGLTPEYELVDVQPDETRTFTLAAFGPQGDVRRLAYVLDATSRGDDIPTVVPGQNIVTWINEVNTICNGEIEEP